MQKPEKAIKVARTTRLCAFRIQISNLCRDYIRKLRGIKQKRAALLSSSFAFGIKGNFSDPQTSIVEAKKRPTPSPTATVTPTRIPTPTSVASGSAGLR